MLKRAQLVMISLATLLVPSVAFAAEGGASGLLNPIAAALAIGLAALGGTLGQGRAVSATVDAMGRNPSASKQAQTAMIIGLALIESLVILSFVIALQVK